MEEKKMQDIIDVRVLLKKVIERKRLFFIVLPIVFVLSCLYIICIPREYDTDVKLAPEAENTFSGGALGSLASSFGFDMSRMESTDAISPTLYPDLMEDNGFVSKFFNFKVETADGELSTNYHDYIRDHQKRAWWSGAVDWLLSLLPKSEEKEVKGKTDEFNPYVLSKKEEEVVKKMQKNINFNVDKKTGVITIQVRDQDKLICKTVADSVCNLLQTFITDYRTNKARTDLEYYQKLSAEAKQEYEKSRRLYGSYADANTDVVLVSFKAKQEDLENDMQLKFNTYTALATQLQQAKAKVQERTPVFTILKGASVPSRASSPKRMIFVLGMMILASFAIVIYILKDEFKLSEPVVNANNTEKQKPTQTSETHDSTDN